MQYCVYIYLLFFLQAISTVMEREREKNEVKDRKVLEILQNKDEEIKNLHEVVATLKQEKDDLFKSYVPHI